MEFPAWKVPCNDEYAYHIPNPKHMPKYTKAKVPYPQDKHTQLLSFAVLHYYPIKSLADPPQYVDTHSNWLPAALKNSTVKPC